MRYHIDLSASVPADSIKSEEEAAAERERLTDPEYVQALLESLDGSTVTATLVATGDDLPVTTEEPVTEPESLGGTPVYQNPTDLDDLMSLPAGETATITVSEGFAAQYGVDPGEYPSDVLLNKLRDLGALDA